MSSSSQSKFFNLMMLPEELIQQIFLNVMDLETYKNLATIPFFDPYFNEFQFCSCVLSYDTGVVLNDDDLEAGYRNPYKFGYLKFLYLCSSLNLESNFIRIANFSAIKFLIIILPGNVPDSFLDKYYNYFLPSLNQLNLYGIFFEIENSKYRQTVNQLDTQDFWAHTLSILKRLRGIYIKAKAISFLIIDQINSNLILHSRSKLKGLKLVFLTNTFPSYIENSFITAPLTSLSIEIRNGKQLGFIKRFENTLKKLKIRVPFPDERLILETYTFPNLSQLLITTSNGMVSLINCDFESLKKFQINLVDVGNFSKVLIIKHCSFLKLGSITTSVVSNMVLINNSFENLRVIPSFSLLDYNEVSGTIVSKENYWPRLCQINENSGRRHNEDEDYSTSEEDWCVDSSETSDDSF